MKVTGAYKNVCFLGRNGVAILSFVCPVFGFRKSAGAGAGPNVVYM